MSAEVYRSVHMAEVAKSMPVRVSLIQWTCKLTDMTYTDSNDDKFRFHRQYIKHCLDTASLICARIVQLPDIITRYVLVHMKVVCSCRSLRVPNK